MRLRRDIGISTKGQAVHCVILSWARSFRHQGLWLHCILHLRQRTCMGWVCNTKAKEVVILKDIQSTDVKGRVQLYFGSYGIRSEKECIYQIHVHKCGHEGNDARMWGLCLRMHIIVVRIRQIVGGEVIVGLKLHGSPRSPFEQKVRCAVPAHAFRTHRGRLKTSTAAE